MSGFNLIIKVDEIGSRVREISISADEKGRKDISERMGLVDIKSFDVDVKVKRIGKQNKFKVNGVFNSLVVQNCVVSLENFDKKYSDKFSVIFEEEHTKPELEDVFDADSDDIEYIVDGKLDIGEIILEYFSLSLDDNPKKNGAKFDERIEAKPEESKNNPFMVLKKLK